MKREPMFRRYLRFWGADPRRNVDDELEFHLGDAHRRIRARAA